MSTTHGPHVADRTRYFSMCQEFPEEHIQCLLPGSREGTHALGDVIVKSGSSPEGVYHPRRNGPGDLLRGDTTGPQVGRD